MTSIYGRTRQLTAVSAFLVGALAIVGTASSALGQINENSAGQEISRQTERLASSTRKGSNYSQIKKLLNYRNQNLLTEGLKKDQITTAVAKCLQPKFSSFAGKYAVATETATGEYCAIYDLGFPTLMARNSKQLVTQLPVEKFRASDYLSWIRGDFDQIYRRLDDRKKGFDSETQLASLSWVGKLKFKPTFVMSQAVGAPMGWPSSFRISDLDLGMRGWTASIQNNLKDLAVTMQNTYPQGSQQLLTWAQQPESLLKSWNFVWNDLEKVYEVFLEGDFLPIQGPVKLVDFKQPYKLAVESIFRSLVFGLLQQMLTIIPEPTTQKIVSLVLEESSLFLDDMYLDRGRQLEEVLMSIQSGQIQAPGISTDKVETALNLNAVTSSIVIPEYLRSVIAGQPYDWNRLEILGYSARYALNKQREVRRNELNNYLFQTEQCSLSPMNNSFVICQKSGQNQAVRSLISEDSFLFWNLGSLKAMDFKRPSEILAKRSASWLLSSGLKIFAVPFVPTTIQGYVSDALRDFSIAGINDEAELRAHLFTKKWKAEVFTAAEESTNKWLYLQDINPLLPKSLDSEKSWIVTQAKRLGLSESDLSK